MKRRFTPLALLVVASMGLAGCGDDGDSTSADDAAKARGPIKIWYSNNPQEVEWGKKVVDAWNAEHPDEEVTAEEIPTGKSSEEVISAAITAGTTPCLIYNTSPASVPQFEQQGGLVSLSDFPDGDEYIEERTGGGAQQYKSSDGKYYQMPWKQNPVMIFYNKDAFKKAGIDAEKPPLSTYDEFIATSKKLVSSGATKYAIYPSPTSEFYQSWFDFYPLYAAESGQQLVEDGKATFDSPAGHAVADFWRELYGSDLAAKEPYNGDSFADGKAAMAIVGPWAIASYQDKVDWGAVPVPTSTGKPAEETKTFSDAKNVGMYSTCDNRGTAWDFLKFSTSQEQDGDLLTTTGQMPMRTDLETAYPDYFAENPAYTQFADQADRTVEVPNVPNSIEIWQTFRDSWSESVIFGKSEPADALGEAAKKIDSLAK